MSFDSGVLQNNLVYSDVYFRDMHGDGDCGNPAKPAGIPRAGMETDVAGFPWGWKQMSRDSRGDGTNLCGIPAEVYLYLTFVVHLQQQKFVFELLNNVFSDFTDTNCIVIS